MRWMPEAGTKTDFLEARRPLHLRGRALAVLALAWIAGYVDTVGFLALIGVYTSHMSGNTAALGRYFAVKDWEQAARHGWPVLAFVIGLIGGATLTELARRRGYHSRMSLVMLVEIILLAIIAQANPQQAASTAWLGLPAIAMGMQTVTITRVGEQRVYSTYITASLARFGEGLAGYGFWVADRYRARHDGGGNDRHGWLEPVQGNKIMQHVLLNLGLWGLFLIGGLSGANVEAAEGLYALWWPILGLILLVLLDWRHPISPIRKGEPLGFEA